jgi:nicotinamidase-related amidase
MDKVALLIIDMQVGNFSDPNPVYKADELLARTKSLVIKGRSAQIPILYVQNNGGSGDPDEYGSAGWQIHPSVAPIKREIMVEKKTPDAFHKTGLHKKLKSMGIKNLVIAGLQTEYCVDTTCRRAFSLGYNVILVKDAHSTWNSSILNAEKIIEHHNHVLSGFFVILRNEVEIKF